VLDGSALAGELDHAGLVASQVCICYARVVMVVQALLVSILLLLRNDLTSHIVV